MKLFQIYFNLICEVEIGHLMLNKKLILKIILLDDFIPAINIVHLD